MFRRIYRTPIFFAFAAGLLLALAAPASAQQDGSFTVSGISVDIRAESAVAARELAFAEAQRRAFRELVQRLASAEALARLPELSNEQLESLVRDVGIDRERASSVRYIAEYTVRFRPEQVRQLLRTFNIAFADAQANSLLVVPVYIADGPPILWEDANPWREVWASRGGNALVPTIVPLGDLSDVAALDAAQAVDADTEGLTLLARRYDVENAMIAIATVTGLEQNIPPQLRVTLFPFGNAVPQIDRTRNYSALEGETLADLLRRAVEDIGVALDQSYKEVATPSQETLSSLPTLIRFQTFGQWNQIRQSLDRMALVQMVEIVALSRGEASVVLHHIGDQRQFEQLLSQSGYSLAWDGARWQLVTAGGAAAQ